MFCNFSRPKLFGNMALNSLFNYHHLCFLMRRHMRNIHIEMGIGLAATNEMIDLLI